MPLPKGRNAVLSLLLPLDKAPQVTASLGRADDLALPSWGSNCFFQGLEMQGQAMWHRAQCRETVQGTAYSSPPTWRVHGFTYKKLHWKQGQRRMQGWVSSQPNCATQIKFKSIDICFYFRSLENIQRSLGIKKPPRISANANTGKDEMFACYHFPTAPSSADSKNKKPVC